jgi:hypothetical protein
VRPLRSDSINFQDVIFGTSQGAVLCIYQIYFTWVFRLQRNQPKAPAVAALCAGPRRFQ